MKIAVIHSFYSNKSPSGENTVVQMQVEALREAGHEVRLIAAYSDDLSTVPGYKVKTAKNVIAGTGIDPTSELQFFEPDVIHIHNLFPNFSTNWLHKWHGPIVATIHNFRPVCASGILFRDGSHCTLCPDSGQWNGVKHACYRDSRLATIPLAVRNRNGVNTDPVMSRADHIVFLSERSRNSYHSFGWVSKGDSIVPNFVNVGSDLKEYNAAPKDWIYVGRLSPEKGIVKLLQHWPESESINVYGDGPDSDIVKALSADNIRVHGLQKRPAVLKAISGSKGLVIPSTCAENFPTVYAEALAAGIPVIGKTGNAAADDIIMSQSGQVFSNWNEVPQVIEQINIAHQVHSMAARDRFNLRFTSASWLQSMLKVYGRVRIQGHAH